MKRPLLSLLTGLIALAGAASAAHAGPVDLVRADPSWCVVAPACSNGRVVIEVDNLAFDKDIVVDFETPGGGRAEAPAFYLHPVGDGSRERWVAFINGQRGDTFELRYSAAGETFVNDNDGAGFRFDQGMADGVIVQFHEFVTPFNFGAIRINVRNLGFNKRVGMVFTRNDWATYETVGARYIFGDGDQEEWLTFFKPNLDGAQDIQFAVFYEDLETGVTYWDSNGGINYRYSYYNRR